MAEDRRQADQGPHNRSSENWRSSDRDDRFRDQRGEQFAHGQAGRQYPEGRHSQPDYNVGERPTQQGDKPDSKQSGASAKSDDKST